MTAAIDRIYPSHRPLPLRTLNALGDTLQRVRATPVLDETKIVRRAVAEVGADDFGHPAFREGMRRWFDAVNHAPHLTTAGRIVHRLVAHMRLTNLLRVQRAFKEHPDLLRAPVREPLYVVGLPRSGTTLLYNLLSLDPGRRPLLNYEALRPVGDSAPRFDGRDERLTTLKREWRLFDYMLPQFRAIHDAEPGLPEECGILFDCTFQNPMFLATARIPAYAAWLETQDRRPAYAFYADVLKLLQAQQPDRRWVLKCPYHLWALDALLEAVPEARIVHTHRDLAEVLPSLASMVCALRSMHCDRVDRFEIAEEELDRWSRAVQRALEVRESADRARFFDVQYRDLVADPVATVESIYGHFGSTVPEGMRDRMGSYLAENPQHKHGAHPYSLGQFGLSREQIATRFRVYAEHYLAEPK